MDDQLAARGLLDEARSVEVSTSFRPPSAPITLGKMPGSPMAAKKGEKPALIQGLQFEPATGGTADPDEPMQAN